jgi:hypothetical protein
MQGWTPQWLAWSDGGGVGEEPQKFAPYVHAGESIPLPSEAAYEYCHSAKAYGECLGQSSPLALAGDFRVTDRIQSLSIGISTADLNNAGTTGNVYVTVLGVVWGPLDNGGDNFEAGSSRIYNLFELFPDKIPPNPLVGDLTSTMVSVEGGNFWSWFWSGDGDWRPAKIDVYVNNRLFVFFYPSQWLTTWPPGLNFWMVPIDLAAAR